MARVVSSIRSGPSRKPCYLRFTNETSRRVSIIWMDYNGSARTYGTLDPGRHFDIHTYEGHPWVCEDYDTSTRMLLNGATVFYPSSNYRVQLEPYVEKPDDHVAAMRCYLPVLIYNEQVTNHNEIYFGCRREQVRITVPVGGNRPGVQDNAPEGHAVLTLLERSAEVVKMNLHSRSDIDFLHIPVGLKEMLNSFPWNA